MSAGISPENQDFIDDAIAAGHYASREEVLDDAVSRLRSHHQLKEEINRRAEEMEQGKRIELESDEELRKFFDEFKAEIKQRIQRGIDEIENGQGIHLDSDEELKEFLEEIKRSGRERARARQAGKS